MQKYLKKIISLVICFGLVLTSVNITFASDDNTNSDIEITAQDLQDPEYYRTHYSENYHDNNENKQDLNSEISLFSDDTLAKANNGVLGCDVSKWQGNINWNQAKNAGVQYALIRVGYRGRTDGIIQLDPNFKTNIQNALNAGIKVGAYFYSEAINEQEAVEEANTLLSNIYMYNITMPLVIDYEGFNQNERIGQANLSKARYTNIVSAFCERIKNAGYTPMVYASASFYTDHLEGEYLSNAYRIWSAAYSYPPEHYNSVKYDFWQFTSSGNGSQYGMESNSVDLDYWYNGRNITGNDYSTVFDANYYYNMYPDLQRAFGHNSAELLYHFINHGMAEGRVACASFDVLSYKQRYPELQKLYGNNFKSYFEHYMTHKKSEPWRDGSPIKYKVKFVSEGKLIKTTEASYGRSATAPNVKKSGYVLAGWDKNFDDVTSDMTVNAQWKAASYTITYDANGGKISKSNKSVTYLEKYGNLDTPTRNGYTFDGWYTSATGGVQITSESKVEITKDITIYAHWKANSYDVTYDANGGSVNETGKSVVMSEKYGSLPTPTRSGYSFDGWWTSIDSGDRITETSKVTIAQNHKLYAHWKLNDVTVQYSTHVKNIGWQSQVDNGKLAGTTGRGLQLEAIKVNLSTKKNLGIIYTTHVKNDGWHNNSFNNELSGTTGQNKQIEAIMIKLTGADADKYDIYYRVHAQNYGWLAWVKNGQPAGTEGYSCRLEAVQIIITAKGKDSPTNNYGNIKSQRDNSFISKNNSKPAIKTDTDISVQSHVQNIGWQNSVSKGDISGTTSKGLRIEGIKLSLKEQAYSGGISYKAHVQNIGWQPNVQNGKLAGTTGKSLRIEAINIALTGNMAKHYDVYYRVHVQNYGWLAWAKNGQNAGTIGKGLRLESLQVVLIPKGEKGPNINYNGINSQTNRSFY